MKKKKVVELITEAENELLDQHEKSCRLVIATLWSKRKGRALYYRVTDGSILARKINFNNTTKYEDDTIKLLRFPINYWDAAKAVALEYMSKHEMGFHLYDENGIIWG